jgi:hypothetical protein
VFAIWAKESGNTDDVFVLQIPGQASHFGNLGERRFQLPSSSFLVEGNTGINAMLMFFSPVLLVGIDYASS